MKYIDKVILERLASNERAIDQLTVQMIVSAFKKRMYKTSYGPTGVVAVTTERILFVGTADKHSPSPDTEWSLPLGHVGGAIYLPFTLNVYTNQGGVPGRRFPVGGFSCGDPARKWAQTVCDLVGPGPAAPVTPGVLHDERQVKQLIEYRKKLRDGVISQAQFNAAEKRLFRMA